MKTKELIEWLRSTRDYGMTIVDVFDDEDKTIAYEIIKRLEELDTLKAYLHKDVLDEVERLEAKRR